MKKLLILIVFSAVFLHFYPQPALERWYMVKKTTMLNIFSEATDTRVSLKADKIYKDLTPRLDQFNANEQQYLKEITMDKNSVKVFFIQYCQEKKHNSKFHVSNQKIVCAAINNYQSLL